MEFIGVIISILGVLFYVFLTVLAFVIPLLLSLAAAAGWIYFFYRIIHWAVNR